MEHFVGAFTRVLRKYDDADSVLRTISELEEASPSTATPSIDEETRLRVLDLPPLEEQERNVARSSSRSRADLLELAAEHPEQLTGSELELLSNRLWLDKNPAEKKARNQVTKVLFRVSADHYGAINDRLEAVRRPLYATHEELALDNAEDEWSRRREADWRAKRNKTPEDALMRSRPWVRRLWDEIKREKEWGYAVFVDSSAATDEAEWEEFDCTLGAAFMHAMLATGCWMAVGSQWRLQYLARPKFGSQGTGSGQEDEDNLTSGFDKLREQFRSIREQTRVTSHDATAVDASSGPGDVKLKPGILDNVFLVVTRECVNSVLSRYSFADDMQIWAVDPDYVPEPGDDEIGYQGYLKVRVQQLVNNFFEVRKFHPEEYSMRTLWKAAQNSRNNAFVSVREEEQGLFKVISKGNPGSALRM
ncbi:hypothetical protein F4780DRAFT_604121 [Xylariomycetidae sp. FL0641]|nr:hypothetical protein F4780DRAFT_604121 [Xylariomycetidae sp. FL0641]